MRLLLVISLLVAGCSTSRQPIPEQPNAPTSEGIVATVSKQWDTADQKVAASVSIARENADRPDIVRSETSVALSFLPPPEPGELALARARAAKADQKDYTAATAFGKNLLASIDKNWAKVEADNREALRVSQLKDARIVELTKAVEQAKKDAAANLWTMAGVGIAAIGAVAMVFAGPRIGATLILSGGAIGAFPYVVDSEYFSYIAGGTLALAAGLGIYWLWDRVRDSANAPYEPPQK
ncbi:MAG: hypothetical protein EBR83_09385 [Verrucomicrobia bacterium]|nr:hypothetical protein [Verrucomicrobiota bacterium]